MSIVVTYLASPREYGHIDWSRLDCLCASIKLLTMHTPKWPIIIFHEDYTEEDKNRILSINNNVTFKLIDFKGHEQHYKDNHPGTRVGTYGYCMMCRFFSGQLQSHELLQQYTHYLRLDDDSYIMEPLNENAFAGSDYVYISHSNEKHQDLWKYTINFMNQEKLRIPTSGYSDHVPYNNFHIASLRLWQHPIIKKFIQGMEDMHAWTKLGWTDASIHKMIALMLCPALGFKVSTIQLMYRHNQHCAHPGRPHNKYCYDHRNTQYNWGPPSCLEK